MARSNARESILDAAQAVVAETGAVHMTLDAVAAKAGVSKGGLIYHFPSKEDLLKGMVERLAQEFESEREAELAKLPESRSRELKAHILAFTKHFGKRERLMAALMAVFAHDPNPKTMEPAQEAYRRMLERLRASGGNVVRALVIALAVDGMKMMGILKVLPLDADLREQAVQEMLRMAEEL